MKLLPSISPSVAPPNLGIITLLLSHTTATTRERRGAVNIQKSIRLSLAGGGTGEVLPLLLAVVLLGRWLAIATAAHAFPAA